METAQKTITDEFSLDRDGSALSRMSRMIGEFRTEVREALVAIGAQKAESKRATRHGFDFEDQLGDCLAEQAQRMGDVHSATGNTTGTIKNCKVGDHVIELGPAGGPKGGDIVVAASPETVAKSKKSVTAKFLAPLLKPKSSRKKSSSRHREQAT